MRSNVARSLQSERERAEEESRRFVDSLSIRYGELEGLARKAQEIKVFGPAQLAEFRLLFDCFRDLSDEFLLLSQLTERALEKAGALNGTGSPGHRALETHFRRLQVPVLQHMIATHLRLLRVWDDCLRCGENLPYGAYDVFVDTLRVLYQARSELERPCYSGLLDETALRNADRVDRLLGALIDRAPRLKELVIGNPAKAAVTQDAR